MQMSFRDLQEHLEGYGYQQATAAGLHIWPLLAGFWAQAGGLMKVL